MNDGVCLMFVEDLKSLRVSITYITQPINQL